jgi:hypothetical protein
MNDLNAMPPELFRKTTQRARRLKSEGRENNFDLCKWSKGRSKKGKKGKKRQKAPFLFFLPSLPFLLPVDHFTKNFARLLAQI